MSVKKIIWIFAGVLCTQTACDLQPKIMAFPDSVGDFISARYPALLADPNTHPEIYNSAVTDYGVYASPDLYGTETDDYVMYASVDDYIVPPQQNAISSGVDDYVMPKDTQAHLENESDDAEIVATKDDYLIVPMYGAVSDASNENIVTVAAGDTLYKIAKQNNMTVAEIAALNKLSEPYELAVGQKLHVRRPQQRDISKDTDVLTVAKPSAGVQTVTRVPLQEVIVQPGDTLYSISRKYAVPVNDLAVMNNLSAPFNLHVGQKLRVPDLANAPVAKLKKAEQPTVTTKAPKLSDNVNKNVAQDAKTQTSSKVAAAKPVKKISSDPSKKLPAITARSSSKFSWPVRGKILSNYGAKSNGLFNDGINIGASRGSAVKAAENGVVAYAGNEVKGMGNLIIVQHSGGWMTVYAHMDSMAVRRGVRVNVGQKIGTVGETGKVDSPQLHFEIRKGTKAYNPSAYLR